jgi:hypothetical protein
MSDPSRVPWICYTLSVFTNVLYPSFVFIIDLTLRRIGAFLRHKQPITLKFMFCAVSVETLRTKFCGNLTEGTCVSGRKILAPSKANLIFRFAQPFRDQWLLHVPAITLKISAFCP